MRDGVCHLLTVESGDGPRVGASFEREEEVSHVSMFSVFCGLTHTWKVLLLLTVGLSDGSGVSTGGPGGFRPSLMVG